MGNDSVYKNVWEIDIWMCTMTVSTYSKNYFDIYFSLWVGLNVFVIGFGYVYGFLLVIELLTTMLDMFVCNNGDDRNQKLSD